MSQQLLFNSKSVSELLTLSNHNPGNNIKSAKDYDQLRTLVSFLGRNPSITDTYTYSVLILSNYRHLSRGGEGKRGLITRF